MITETTIDTLRAGIAEDGQFEVTMRGEVTAIVDALLNGLHRDALLQLRDALSDELAKRNSKAGS